MAKITYPDKTTGSYYTGAEATEVKSVVNANDDAAQTTNEVVDTVVKADKTRNFTTMVTMSGDYTLTWDATGAVNGKGEIRGFVGDGNDIIFSGSEFTIGSIATSVGVEVWITLMYNEGVNKVIVDQAGGSAAAPDVPLLSDDFTGATIDTAKWDVLNTDTPDIVISQNNELIFTPANLVSQDWFDNYCNSDDVFNTTVVLSYDILKLNQNDNVVWTAGLWNGPTREERMFLQKTITSGNVLCVVRIGDSSIISSDVAFDISTVKRVKIIVTASSATFYWNNAGTWTQLATTPITQSVNWKVEFSCGSNTPQTVQGDPLLIDRVRVSTTDSDSIHKI